MTTLPTLNTRGVFTTRNRDTTTPSDSKRRYLLTHLENNDYIMEMDWTSMSGFLACPRKALWSLIHARTEGRSAAMLYGNAIHHGLEAFYRVLSSDQSIKHKTVLDSTIMEQILSRGRHEFQDVPASLLEWRSKDKYARTIEAYIKHWQAGDEENIEILRLEDGSPMIEQAFSLPLTKVKVNQFVPYPITQLVAPIAYNLEGNPAIILATGEDHRFWIDSIHVQWTGVIDLGLLSQGNKWIMDHKTSSMGGDSFWQAFTLSQQLRGYVWAAQEITGHTYEGGVVNALFGRKPTEKGKGKELELERKWLHYRPDQITEWRTGMVSHIEDLIHRLCKGVFPENSVSCVGKYGTCSYLDVCSMPPDMRLTMLASDQYADNVWNPLT